MGRRMVLPDGGPARVVDVERQCRARRQIPLLDRADVHKNVARHLLRIGDAEAYVVGAHHAGVADLAARFAVERGLVENHGTALALVEPCDFSAVADERRHHAFGALSLVAKKFGRAVLFTQREPYRLGRRVARALPGFSRLLALALHRRVECHGIDRDAARPKRVLGEIEGKAISVV